MIYDVLVVWHTGWGNRRLRSHSRWHRGVRASTLTDASNKALAQHPGVWNPQVSMCWPQHPQPRRT